MIRQERLKYHDDESRLNRIQEEEPSDENSNNEEFKSPAKSIEENSFNIQIEKCKIVEPTNRLTPPQNPNELSPTKKVQMEKSGYSEFKVNDISQMRHALHDPNGEKNESTPKKAEPTGGDH